MKTFLRIIIPLLIVGLGAFAAQRVAQMAPAAERKPVEKAVPLVELQALNPQRQTAVIEATGLVTPAQQIALMPQVTGEVVYISPSMVPGGRVKKGELLVRIDASDYKLAVQQQEGNLRSAELQVELEAAQEQLARHEWEVLGEEGQPPPLFSRQSQRAAAEASLESGRRGLDRAQLNLNRTTLRAPFDATVLTENVDRGQVVGPQSQLAQLMGTGKMWVMVSVVMEELDLIRIPGVNAEEGSPARVEQRLSNGKSIVRRGEVTRLVDKLDDRTRRAQVVVTIDDALDTSQGLPLLAGAHVRVGIEGKGFDQVYTIPRQAVYEGNVIWVTRGDGELKRRELVTAWGDDRHIYATSGPEPGDQLVLTRLSMPIAGMKVAPLPSRAQAEEPAATTGATTSANEAAPATASPPQHAAKKHKAGVN